MITIPELLDLAMESCQVEVSTVTNWPEKTHYLTRYKIFVGDWIITCDSTDIFATNRTDGLELYLNMRHSELSTVHFEWLREVGI